MRPSLHPTLVNGRTGDPALYIETLFERRAILFDLGDIAALSPRKVQRLEHVFVSHTHIDHFIGFDRLLRLLVGREKTVRLYGPEGFIAQVEHKLAGYRWNLVERYAVDLVFEVMEIADGGETHNARFRFKQAFAREDWARPPAHGQCRLSRAAFHVSTAVSNTAVPASALPSPKRPMSMSGRTSSPNEAWRSGRGCMNSSRRCSKNRPDDFRVRVADRRGHAARCLARPGHRHARARRSPTSPMSPIRRRTARRIVALARDADILFIEAAFAEADTALAAERAHLTTGAAGHIARAANVRRVEPFHFSPRYEGEDAEHDRGGRGRVRR